MDIRFYNEIESNPIIAAVKDMDGLHKAVKIDSIRIIFILCMYLVYFNLF